MRASDWDPIRAEHYGQRLHRRKNGPATCPHPTNAAASQKVLAKAAPSTHDPKRTKAPSKSRSAVSLPQCYLPLRSTGEIAGETARVHHAARRRGSCVAARGARAAASSADDRVSQRRIVLGICTDGGRLPQRPRRNRLTHRCACLSETSVAAG